MAPQGGPHSANAAHAMSGYPNNHQSPAGPSPGGRGGWAGPQGGYGAPSMTPQGYGNMQMPGSAGGYGRGDQSSNGGWGPPSAGAYPNNGPNNQYGGYQG